MTPEFTALVVGSGIAGLRAAVEMARSGGRVGILTKDGPTDSSSDKAQGGLAAVLSDDDEVALHYEDTLRAGDGLCSEGAVRILVETLQGLDMQWPKVSKKEHQANLEARRKLEAEEA